MSKITVFEHLRACAEEARDYAGGLVAKLAKTATEAIEELEQAKADRAQSVAITIPATGWASETGGDYPHYYDIAAEGVTASDRAEITIAPGSLGTAKGCARQTRRWQAKFVSGQSTFRRRQFRRSFGLRTERSKAWRMEQ